MKYTSKLILNGTEYEFAEGQSHKTFTVTFTETSNPAQFNPVWSDDASGLTAGSTDFDEFFGYSAVRLNTSGVETAEITQTQSGGNGKLDITQLGTLTSGDNVMIKFPVRGIKMEKSGSTCTLSITSEPNKTGYQYYAHTRGTTVKNKMYIGAYLNYNSSNVLKSWSGQSPSTNISITNTRTYAQANGTGYDQIAFFQKMYISALYMMKYGNPYSQDVVGQGLVNNSNSVQTGGTNSQTNATYGTTSKTTQIKLFGLEDRWGNLNEWLDGTYNQNNKIYVNNTNQNFSSYSGSDYIDSGCYFSSSTEGVMSSILGTNIGMFLPSTLGSASYSTYYTDSNKEGGTTFYIPHLGGMRLDDQNAGIFHLFYNWTTSAGYNWAGSRLMYL